MASKGQQQQGGGKAGKGEPSSSSSAKQPYRQRSPQELWAQYQACDDEAKQVLRHSVWFEVLGHGHGNPAPGQPLNQAGTRPALVPLAARMALHDGWRQHADEKGGSLNKCVELLHKQATKKKGASVLAALVFAGFFTDANRSEDLQHYQQLFSYLRDIVERLKVGCAKPTTYMPLEEEVILGDPVEQPVAELLAEGKQEGKDMRPAVLERVHRELKKVRGPMHACAGSCMRARAACACMHAQHTCSCAACGLLRARALGAWRIQARGPVRARAPCPLPTPGRCPCCCAPPQVEEEAAVYLKHLKQIKENDPAQALQAARKQKIEHIGPQVNQKEQRLKVQEHLREKHKSKQGGSRMAELAEPGGEKKAHEDGNKITDYIKRAVADAAAEEVRACVCAHGSEGARGGAR